MTEKQSKFDFMKNNISKVITLGYIGGQVEDLGGYCEPLIIEYFDGMKQYVLHTMAQRRKTNFKDGRLEFGEIINNHKKVLLLSKLELISVWELVRKHLGVNKEWSWEETDSVCGCDTTLKEFYKTKRREVA